MAPGELDATGRLAGGIAHDFNNLFFVIRNYTRLTVEGLSDDDPMRNDLEQVLEACDRAGEIIRKLLVFAGRDRANPIVVELDEIMREIGAKLAGGRGDQVQLDLRTAGDEGRVRIDPAHVELILEALVTNAAEAMPDGGTIVVSTASDATGSVLSVADSGEGIPDEHRASVFEPFFTTRPKAEGRGMGLSMVAGIVRRAGGRLELTSAPGKGTRVDIWFPEAVPDADGPGGESRAAGGSGSAILVVEDEDDVRGLVVRMLREQGYEVLEATSGAGALALAAARGEPVALVIADSEMPEMSGAEVIARMRDEGSAKAFLMMSGYPQAGDGPADDGSVPHLDKPFSGRELLAKVEALLDPGVG